MANDASDHTVDLMSAIAAARQTLSRWLKRGRVEFSTDHLRESLAENGRFVDSVISACIDDGWIEDQKSEPPQGISKGLRAFIGTTYRIRPAVLETSVKAYLELAIDESQLTIQRPGFCRHVVTLSAAQLKLVRAMCAAGDAGITGIAATRLREGEKSDRRQFRTVLNRSLSLLGVKLERSAWKIIEK